MKEWDTKILATDISRQVLETAQRGIYSGERIAPLPAAWKANYFRRIDADNYIISDKIRNNVIFRRLNLVAPVFPFKRKLHVIFCRNVMIYFDNKTKEELVSKFYEHLEYGDICLSDILKQLTGKRQSFNISNLLFTGKSKNKP